MSQQMILVDEDLDLTVPAVDPTTRRPTLSPSALSDYEICGRRGQYHHDPNIPKGPPTINMARGVGFHKGLESANLARLARDLSPGVPEPDLVEHLVNVAETWVLEVNATQKPGLFTDAELAETRTIFDRVFQARWQGGEAVMWREKGIELVAFEQLLYVPSFGTHHAFHGYADAIYSVPEVGIVGVDYKLAGKMWSGAKLAGDPRVLIQAPLYAEAWERLHPGLEMNWFAYDLYTIGGKFHRVWVPTAARLREPFIRRWEEVSASIKLHEDAGLPMPTNPSHILCSEKWCGFWEVCPMGGPLTEAMGQVSYEDYLSQAVETKVIGGN